VAGARASGIQNAPPGFSESWPRIYPEIKLPLFAAMFDRSSLNRAQYAAMRTLAVILVLALIAIAGGIYSDELAHCHRGLDEAAN
jgi:hypothetical protein